MDNLKEKKQTIHMADYVTDCTTSVRDKCLSLIIKLVQLTWNMSSHWSWIAQYSGKKRTQPWGKEDSEMILRWFLSDSELTQKRTESWPVVSGVLPTQKPVQDTTYVRQFIERPII